MDHFKIKPFERSKTKDGRVRDKVAIVGFAGTSRHLAPYDDDEFEIWGLNEAHRADKNQKLWMRRITRWFQLHQRWDFTKKNNIAYVEHFEWLQKEHPFPIYMVEHHDDVPSSIKFPLDEICDEFLSNSVRGILDKKEVMNKYFTSSFAYMCSMALYLGFKEIAVFGFEMGTDTEYRYQKGSTEYWLGIAAGRDVKTFIPTECKLLAGALYGVEVSRMINRQRLEFLKRKCDIVLKQRAAEMQRVHGRRVEIEDLRTSAKIPQQAQAFAIRGNELLQKEVDAMSKTADMNGYVRCLTDLIKTVDNMHAGKDPGDGYLGPAGDQDPAAEQAAQDAAIAELEAKAEQELETDE